MLLQFFQGVLPAFSAWVTKRLFDYLGNVLIYKSITDIALLILPLIIALVVVEILTYFFSTLNTFISSDLNRKLSIDNQVTIYHQIAKLEGLAYFENPEFYETIMLAKQGVDTGPSQLIETISIFIRSIVVVISFVSVLALASPFLIVAILVASIPQFFMQLKFGHQRLNILIQNNINERRANYLGNILHGLKYIKEIRFLGLSDYFLDKFKEITNSVHSKQRKQQLNELQWQVILGSLSTIISGVAFAMIIFSTIENKGSIGDISLYTTALVNMQSALLGVFFSITSINENLLYFNYFEKLMSLKSAIHITHSPKPIPAMSFGIEFRNVSFRYSENHPWVLKEFNLIINSGETLALVGLNGSGKSTLVKLLTRLYDPVEGTILWDGIDIREFNPTDLRGRIGAVFQDFVRFELTAFENIAVGNVSSLQNSSQTLTNVNRAVEKSGLSAVFEKLSKGYWTVLSHWLSENNDGVDLSGGEWQKIALARMFTRDADLVILDEPTSALDVEAEDEFYKKFFDSMTDKTTLLISHRFSTIRMADRIAVIENGKISEYGSHSQLLLLGGGYAKMYALQANKYR